MLQLSPRMALEAPREYVAFVERHLPRLRRDAALVVGTGHLADELYPEVLSEVAVRWGRFELLRNRLGRRGAADAYLRRAFARHAKRWQDSQITPVEVEIWQVEQLPDGVGPYAAVPPAGGARAPDLAVADLAVADLAVAEVTVPEVTVAEPRAVTVAVDGWQPEQLAPLHTRVGWPGPVRPLWSSAALRLAPVLLANSRVEVRPLAEAAIAWWHAYEARRRRRYAVAIAALILVLGIITRVQARDSETWYAPVAPAATAGLLV